LEKGRGGEDWKERREQKKREGKVPEKSGEKKELAIFLEALLERRDRQNFDWRGGKGEKGNFKSPLEI